MNWGPQERREVIGSSLFFIYMTLATRKLTSSRHRRFNLFYTGICPIVEVRPSNNISNVVFGMSCHVSDIWSGNLVTPDIQLAHLTDKRLICAKVCCNFVLFLSQDVESSRRNDLKRNRSDQQIRQTISSGDQRQNWRGVPNTKDYTHSFWSSIQGDILFKISFMTCIMCLKGMPLWSNSNWKRRTRKAYFKCLKKNYIQKVH